MAVRVVIAGGSFGGLTTAYELRRLLGPEQVTITLIAKERRFTFVPSLPWVAMGARRLEQISFDLAGPLGAKQVRFAQETVTAFDTERKIVVTTGAERFKAAVVGPGLGREEGTLAEIRTIVRGLRIPLVLDADALVALASSGDVRGLLAGRPAPTVLTPHDGELSRLLGHPPGTDRLAVVGELAASLGVVVVAKGPTTVVSGPDRRTYCVTSGSPALATPGTGDVLAGVIGAVLARSGELRGAPLVTTDMGEVARLAALAAHAHGAAAALGPSVGLLSGDLPELVSKLLSGYIAPR